LYKNKLCFDHTEKQWMIFKEHYWKKQEIILRYFLELAMNHDLPVNLHGKSAEKELFRVLSQYDIKNVVVHWFTGSPELIKIGINYGYFFSVTPAVFYSKKMQKVVELTPVEQLLSESDGPVKYKGQPTFIGKPALMKDVVQKIAQIKQQNHKEIERILYNTARKIFLGKN
ncbi:MAG: TatD family hydrolase, partial [Promethearchaeota archaeon]